MANAFHSIAPLSDARTSSSKKPYYDVFINHRGKDVKHKLASIIYHTLGLMGVHAFLDQEELEVGASFPEAIEEAMWTSSVHIAIFSPNYAESPWCLEELSVMLKTKVTIIPVFYGVDPSDLRYVEKGQYAVTFFQHRSKRRYNSEKIEEWKEALIRVSYLSGCILHADNDKCDEGKLLKEIVDSTLGKMKKVPLESATYPVGLEEAVQDFESKVGSFTEGENVHIVGIFGMGGSGKTTLATELYNRKCSSMSRSSFLSNVRDAASTNTLDSLKEKLLMDLRIKHFAGDLRSMSVVIVLDDVDHVDQMHALLPPKHNLGPGSFIIVTTRDVDVLTSWGIPSIYTMKLLDGFNAKQLFCRHAFLHPYSQFGSEHLVENYHKFQDLIERFVEACKGLPLSLKVFGAMVNGKSEARWEAQLSKISGILPKEIAKHLRLSYDALDQEEQQIFLDIACFFIGEEKSLVVAVLDGSGWSGEIGLEILVNKCLVELDEHGLICMHDHLRDLGRDIARNVSPSRIWKEEQISIQGGTTQIRGIVVGLSRQQLRVTHYPPPLEHCMEKIAKSLPALQLLAVRGNDFREEFAALSRDLVWLRWCDFNGSKLPSWLSLANLTALELHNAKNLEELWHDDVQPLQLRQLLIDLTGSICFQGLPRSIGHLRHLKKIVLNGSGNGMRRLPEELCHLESLEILQLSDFKMLSSLPDHFGDLKNMRVLVLSGVQLTSLPDSFKQLRLLQFLDISNSQSFFFNSEMLHVLEFMTELQILRISHCPQLVELPYLTSQVSLRELDLRYTGLRELPNNIGQVAKLESLLIGSENLTSLPASLGELSCLTSLAIYDCDMLKSLPEAFGGFSNLQSLQIEDAPVVDLSLWISLQCNLKSLKCLSLSETQVRRISICDDCCPSLETLRLSCNIHLERIEILPRKVREITVHGCERMQDMRGILHLLNLESLAVTDCPKLKLLPIPTYMHSVGRKISVRGCPQASMNGHTADYDGYVNASMQDHKKYDHGYGEASMYYQKASDDGYVEASIDDQKASDDGYVEASIDDHKQSADGYVEVSMYDQNKPKPPIFITNVMMIKGLLGEACKASYAAYKNGGLVKNTDESTVVIAFSEPLDSADFSQRGTKFGAVEITANNDYFGSMVEGISKKNPKPALVHQGILNMFLHIWNNSNIQHEVEGYLGMGRSVLFTGHSIGGGIATLATLATLGKWPKCPSACCITFGFPLIGDEVLAGAIRRQRWANQFCHVVSKGDIFARILLAPLISVSAILKILLPYWRREMQQRDYSSSDIPMEMPIPQNKDISKGLLWIVLKHAASVVNYTKAISMGPTNKLIASLRPVVKLCPYRPFGNYMFCLSHGAVWVENHEAVLPMLSYSLAAATHDQDQVLEASISEHIGYDRLLHGVVTNMVKLEDLSNLSLSKVAYSAVETQLDGLGVGIQNPQARLALKAAGEVEKQRKENMQQLEEDLQELVSEEGCMPRLKRYRDTCFTRRGISFYDCFKQHKSVQDFNANMSRIRLAGFWDGVVERVEKHELPDEFHAIDEWIRVGTEYRLLVEPLDIANYYRLGKHEDSGDYLSCRPRRYSYLQKWLADKELNGKAGRGIVYPENMTKDSLFWAYVEEISWSMKWQDSEALRARCVEFGMRVKRMIESKVVYAEEVMLGESSFVKWWNQLSEEDKATSPLNTLFQANANAALMDIRSG